MYLQDPPNSCFVKLNTALLLRSNLDSWAPVPGLLNIFLSYRQRRLAVPVCCEGCMSEKSANAAVCGPVASGVVPGDPGLLPFRHSCPRWAGAWATEKARRAAGVSEGIGPGIRRKESDFGIDHLVMSMCRVVSCIVGKGCLLRPLCSLGKALLAFVQVHFVLQSQTCLFLQVSLAFLLLHSNPLWWKGHLFLLLVVEGLTGLHRASQLQLLWH